MNDRESFDAQQEATRETLGKTSQANRERLFGGLQKYLAAEVAHARRATRAEARKAKKQET